MTTTSTPMDPRMRERRIEVKRALGRRRLRVILVIAAVVIAAGATFLVIESPFLDVDRVSVAYGGVVVCAGGVARAHDEGAVAAHMAGRHIQIDCDLGLGPGQAVVLGTDLGYGYIDENRTTS